MAIRPLRGGGVPQGDVSAAPRAHARLVEVTTSLERYFQVEEGERVALTNMPVDWTGWSRFARRVAQALRQSVPAGATITYGQLAASVGSPGAARAIGRVMASNPVPLIVPCHRVVSRSGLRGFAWGLDTKRFLLAWEATAQA